MYDQKSVAEDTIESDHKLSQSNWPASFTLKRIYSNETKQTRKQKVFRSEEKVTGFKH